VIRRAFMSEDHKQRAEDQPVTPDTLIEIAPGVFKRLGGCTEEEVLMAALLHGGQVEWEMQQEVRRLTDPEEEIGRS
jgi:hypothetical protein